MTDQEILRELLEQRNMFVSLMCKLERGWWPFVSKNEVAKNIFQILVSTKGLSQSYQKAIANEKAWFEEEMKKCLRQML